MITEGDLRRGQLPQLSATVNTFGELAFPRLRYSNEYLVLECIGLVLQQVAGGVKDYRAHDGTGDRQFRTETGTKLKQLSQQTGAMVNLRRHEVEISFCQGRFKL